MNFYEELTERNSSQSPREVAYDVTQGVFFSVLLTLFHKMDRNAGRLNVDPRAVARAGPVSMFVSVTLCQSSGFGGPGTFVVVFLHMFIKLIQLFGDDDFTNPEGVSPKQPSLGRSFSFSLAGQNYYRNGRSFSFSLASQYYYCNGRSFRFSLAGHYYYCKTAAEVIVLALQ